MIEQHLVSVHELAWTIKLEFDDQNGCYSQGADGKDFEGISIG